MKTILHLSDLHFGTESPPVLTALTRQIINMEPDVVAISGDLTQRARRREFLAAKRFIEAIDKSGARILVVPGNHDIPLFNPVARMLWPFKGYRDVFGTTDVSTVQIDRWRFICVNSVRREKHASGFISARQRREVAMEAGQGRADDITVVITHHPLGLLPSSAEDLEHKGDAATCRSWHDAGVNMILSGHEHRPFLLDATKQIIENEAEESRPLWILNAGTAISSRVRHEHPNSFNLLSLNEESDTACIMVERWDFDTSDNQFVRYNSVDARL